MREGLVKKQKTGGFTLIELLVVMAVIGILASVMLGYLSTARNKANDATRHSAVKEIQKALELAFYDNGSYPIRGFVCSYQPEWETGAFGTALEPYMANMATDPSGDSGASYNGNGKSYCYISQGGGGAGRWYLITYLLENEDLLADDISVYDCNGTPYNFGLDDGYIMARGSDCYSN